MVLSMYFFENQACGKYYAKYHCVWSMEEKEEGCPFSFPLHLSMVHEIVVDNLDGYGLDGTCDGLLW